MKIEVLKSKLQEVIVTEANINYQGSITIDPDLMEAANIYPHEKVHVNNSTRIITYVIPGRRGSGDICLNGGASLHGRQGDKVHVLSYAIIPSANALTHVPIVVHTDQNNRVI
jgi:aspartate 1-decarboxylase